MAEIPLRWPEGGKSDRRARSNQEPVTTRDAKNVRTLDARTGAMKGVQRPGLSQSASSPFSDVEGSASVPVKALGTVTNDRRQVSYSNLVTSTAEPPGSGELSTEESKQLPSQGTPYDIGVDLQENVYVLDGNAGVVKYTSDLQHVWTMPVDRADGEHVLRALDVDEFGGCYFAVTEGGDHETTRIWCVDSSPETRLAGEDEPRLRWEIQVNKKDPTGEIYGHGHVGDLVLAQGRLYTVQNNPEERTSRVVVYGLIGGPDPVVVASWEIAWPCRGIAVKSNGDVVTTHPDEADRGTNPLHPNSPNRAFPGLWNPEDDLEDYETRAWSWISSHRMMPDGTDPVDPARNAQTGEERAIFVLDRTGKGRNVYANDGSTDGNGPFLVEGIHGRRCFEFRGAEGLVGFANSVVEKGQADSQRGILPTYKGAAFAVFMVVELTPSDADRDNTPDAASIECLLFNENEDTGTGGGASSAFDRAILANRQEGNEASNTSTPRRRGHLSVFDTPSSATGFDAAGGVRFGYPHSAHFELAVPGNFVHSDAPAGSAGASSVEVTREPIFGVISYICDGGLDLSGNGHFSFFRYNGSPCDRWNSQEIQSTGATSIGFDLGAGGQWNNANFRLYDLLVLDRKDRDDDTVGAVTCPNYPDDTSSSGVGWVEITSTNSGWGASTSGALTFTGGGGSGAAGTWYSDATGRIIRTTITSAGSGYTSQPTVGATGAGTFAGTAYMYEEAHRSPTSVPAVADVTETELIEGFFAHDFGNGNKLDDGASYVMHDQGSHFAASTDDGDLGLSGSISGHAHPFRLFAPVPTGKPDVNELQQTYPLTVKYEASEQHPIAWIVSNLYGMGNGVSALPSELDSNSEPTDVQDVVTVGDRNAGSDEAGLRRIQDDGDTATASAALASGQTNTAGDRAWARRISEGGSNIDIDNENPYQRLAVDAYGSIYVPLVPDNENRASSVQAFSRENLEHFEWYKSFAAFSSQACYAVAVPLDIPGKLDEDLFYEADIDIENTHAERLFAALDPRDNAMRVPGGSAGSSSTLDTVNRTKLVEVTHPATPLSTREVSFVSVASGKIYRFRLGTDTAWATPAGTPTTAQFDTNARYIHATEHFGRVFLTDGASIYYYDPRLEGVASKDPVKQLKAKRGKLPERPTQVYSWNSRLVAIRGTTDPSNFWMSARNDFENWDIRPAVPSASMAVDGSLPSLGPGVVPDVVNTFVPLTSDIALFGCNSQIHMLRGDPTQGTIELVTNGIGMAFGPSWAKLPDGSVIFMDNVGDLYRYALGAGIEPLSKGAIETELRAIDWSTYYVELVYSFEEDGVRIFQVPYAADGTLKDSWFWDRRTGALWPDDVGASAKQATAALYFDGDEPGDRVLAIGCEDGQVRKVDVDADDDDGTAIDSYVTFELAGRLGHRLLRLREAICVLDDTRDGADLEILASEKANTIPDSGSYRVKLDAGFNLVPFPVCASYVYARLRNNRSESWAFEEGQAQGNTAGRRGALA